MNHISHRERGAFEAFADTLFAAVPGPSPFWTRSAIELHIGPRFDTLIAGLEPDVWRELSRGLNLLTTRAGGVLLFQRPQPFVRLSSELRVQALNRMARSPIAKVRVLYASLKQICVGLLTTAAPGESIAPTWQGMGYPSPPAPPSAMNGASPLRTTTVPRSTTLKCDVVVVGSGAGGGVAAAVLAQAGFDVLVVERGELHLPDSFDWFERAEVPQPMHDIRFSDDQGIRIYQGSAVGGGTLINYSTSLATPKSVRSEWDECAGTPALFTGDDYEASSTAVLRRLEVNTNHSPCGPRDAVMERGLTRLGWDCKPLPRNAVGCALEDCGYCGLGCRRQAKRSTTSTWLEDAQRAGARLVVGADVRKIRCRGGRAVGVDAVVAGQTSLAVDAEAVIVACGSIHSPALLQRSGVWGPSVGRYLRLHPVTAVLAHFPQERVDPWTGTLQARISEQFSDLDGRGYGVRFETAPMHPAPFAAVMPWTNPWRFKQRLAQYRSYSMVGVLVRDQDHGRVTVSSTEKTSIDYRMSARDHEHARLGVIRAAELLASAGAEEVVATTHRPATWEPRRNASVKHFVDALDQAGTKPTHMAYFSFHQMGSLRLGADPTRSATDPSGKVHGVDGLYVMDASLFPTASGVNPMVSIQTLAHLLSGRLARQLSV